MLSSFLLNAGTELWGKKWRKPIMWILRDRPQRFSEIKKKLPDCSVKMLSEALDGMERDGLVIRKQYDGIPVKVTYELTEDIKVIVENMNYYLELLGRFFYKNRQRFNIPSHIVEMLQQQQVSKQ